MFRNLDKDTCIKSQDKPRRQEGHSSPSRDFKDNTPYEIVSFFFLQAWKDRFVISSSGKADVTVYFWDHFIMSFSSWVTGESVRSQYNVIQTYEEGKNVILQNGPLCNYNVRCKKKKEERQIDGVLPKKKKKNSMSCVYLCQSKLFDQLYLSQQNYYC